ncbi:unnamed protein product [Ceutorhynchus assimilis]|uniref:Peptidase S1 domain-containing protein n=1 Tax=Ceutorhynchus assimilis TaxID=467358 RepID=A0A9N9MGD5_9CUCU|nr:unnamed protein product [Ceutorhynchus assimilis]
MNKLVGSICLFVILAVSLNEVIAKPQHPVGIINGTTAEDGEFPYIVQLHDDFNYFYCGGSIIGDRWILTAGHCVWDSQFDHGGSILLGTNVLGGGNGTKIEIINKYWHPQFNYNRTTAGDIPYFDVGIMELEKPITFDSKAQPIKLVDSDDQIPFHKIGNLCGWGTNDTYGEDMPLLQKVSLPLLTDSECRKGIADFGRGDVFNSFHNLCTDQHYNGACYGDSGSPFVIDGIQYGIASWGLPPCGAAPGTLTRISTPSYREFIRNVTGI